MKTAGLTLFILIVSVMNAYTQTAADLAEIWDKNHISKIFPSDVRHKDLKIYLDKLKKLGLKVDEVGSGANREIFRGRSNRSLRY